jgi:hypothetical protein
LPTRDLGRAVGGVEGGVLSPPPIIGGAGVVEYRFAAIGGLEVSGEMGEIGDTGDTGVIGRDSCIVLGKYRYESTGGWNGGDGSGVLYGLRGGLSYGGAGGEAGIEYRA